MPYFPYNPGPMVSTDPMVAVYFIIIIVAVSALASLIGLWHSKYHDRHHRSSHQH